MQPAFIPTREVRTHVLTAAVSLWSIVFCGALFAQGPDPFGPVPESTYGNSLYGNAMPLGSVRAPTTPQATSRPSSWPGGAALEPESLGGLAARPARPVAMPAYRIQSVPAAGSQVIQASAMQAIPGAGQEPGFSFIEEQGGSRRSLPSSTISPSATPIQAPSGTMTPSQPPASVIASDREPIPTAGPAVSRESTGLGAVLLPQLGAAPPGVGATGTSTQPLVPDPTEGVRTNPPPANPYSLDASGQTSPNPVMGVAAPGAAMVAPGASVRTVPPPTTAGSMLLLRNPFQNGVPGDPSPLSERLNSPTGISRQSGPDSQLLAAQVGLIRSFTEAPPGAGVAQGPVAMIRSPNVPQVGEVFVSDGSARSTPAAAAAVTSPVQPPMTIVSAQPAAPASQPSTPATAASVPASQPLASATAPVTPAASAAASISVPMGVASQQRSPSGMPVISQRDATGTQPSSPVAATVSPASQGIALAGTAPTANRYVVESKSADAAALPSGMTVFPLQIPQRLDRAGAGNSANKSSQSSGILLAQAVGQPGASLADSTAGIQAPPGGGLTSSPGLEPGMAPCEGAQILARVGSEIILAADLAGPVNEMIQVNKDKIPPEQIELARRQLTHRLLDARIETKLAYLDAKRQLPAESLTRVEKNISDAFDREEIERMMKRSQADSRQALEVKLQSLGSSLELKRRTFIEQMLAQQWIRQKVKVDGEVSHEEMRAYYHEHIADFETPAQARWEELEVRFARHPSREQAYALIAQMGNQILSGAPLAEVARRSSEGITAANGGQRDWTSRGSLVSQELDSALFGLPVGEPSQILEDKAGFHILRVLERKEAVRTPFTEAQVEIRKKIKEHRVEAEMKAYLDKLRRQVPVWTVFDEQPAKRNARG